MLHGTHLQSLITIRIRVSAYIRKTMCLFSYCLHSYVVVSAQASAVPTMRHRPNVNIPGHFPCSIRTCGFLAESGRDYCCNRCPEHDGLVHSRNCAQEPVPDELISEARYSMSQSSSQVSVNMDSSNFVHFTGT